MILSLVRICAVIVIAIAVAVISNDASAADFRVTWSVPTTCVDGSPLRAGDIIKYDLEAVNQTTLKRTVKHPKVGTAGYLMPLEPGRYGFRIRAYNSAGAGPWSPQVFADSGAVVVPPPDPCDCVCPQTNAPI